VSLGADLSKAEQSFVENTGLAVEKTGAPRIMGRILGLLLIARNPMSLEELAQSLRVSKASVSTNARLCERSRFVRRVSKPGDRRVYYEISPSPFEQMLRARTSALSEILELIEQGIEAVDETNEAGKARLRHTREFYLFLREEMGALLDRWHERKESKGIQDSVGW
jgi:DNA-binding transcriptional regulator GbsR (MarR family)